MPRVGRQARSSSASFLMYYPMSLGKESEESKCLHTALLGYQLDQNFYEWNSL